MSTVLACVIVSGIAGFPADAPESTWCAAYPVLSAQHERGARDPWFSRDKFLHSVASAGLTGLMYHGYAVRFHGDIQQGGVFSVSLTGFIGLSKELYDRDRGRTFSWKDLVWDGLGIAIGYFMFVR